MRPKFVQKMQTFQHRPQLIIPIVDESAALTLHARRVTLIVVDALFLRGKSSRCNSRHTPHLRSVQVSCSD
jgi:hypothetical protein